MQTTLAEPVSSASSLEQPRADHTIEDVYEALHRDVWALLYAFCGDVERATDATQEAFLRLQQQGLSTVRNRRAWLLFVGRNWLRDVARRRKRTAKMETQLTDVVDHVDGAWISCAREETRQLVRDALDQLNELDRSALVMRYGMKWPAARIAQTLETTPQAVDMRLCRARQRLKEVLVEANADFAEPASF